MVRPVGVFLLVFALLSLIVHQIGMFEFLAALATALLAVDILLARLSRAQSVGNSPRERFL